MRSPQAQARAAARPSSKGLKEKLFDLASANRLLVRELSKAKRRDRSYATQLGAAHRASKRARKRNELRAEGTRRLEARRRLALERQLVDMVDQYGTNLGRELHDDLGQQLTGLAFLAKTAERKLAAAGSRQAGDLRRIAELLRAALEKVRDLARGILPMHLHEGSLSPPLAELAERTRATYRRRCEFRGRNVGLKLDPEVALHLYRIAQEAVNNAVKHSRAREITIALRRRGAFLSVSVGDNGVGLPNAASEFTGLGMAILEQRAATIGATLSVHSRPGRGTLVKVSLPVPSPR